MTLARLNGLYPPDFATAARQHFVIGAAPPGVGASRAVEIADARALQAASGLSEAAFLDRHGFVLLPHVTGVRDWDRDAAACYFPEVEAIVRDRLLPGQRIMVDQRGDVLRRGRGTGVPFYADGVHSDGGADADDYAANIAAFATPDAASGWRAGYDRAEVAGVVWLDFWRPTNMAAPLEHMPLALCDVATVAPADIVRTAITGIAPTGRETRHLALRFNPAQRWYYYPRMANDELLVFKLAEFWKDAAPLRNCFHSAFVDPAAPADAELRQSCEHRVSVTVLRG